MIVLSNLLKGEMKFPQKIKFLLFNNRSTLYQQNFKFYPIVTWQNYSFDFIKNSKSI